MNPTLVIFGEGATGMSAFWTSLQTSVSADQLWGVLAGAIGFIAIAVLFAFGYRIVRRLVGGVSKGKVKA